MSLFPQAAADPHRTFPLSLNQQWWKMGVVAILIGWLYSPVLLRMAAQWWNDPDWSHGFLVPVASLLLIWRRRNFLLSLPPQPSALGFLILAVAMAMLSVGIMGAELFLSRISFVFLIAGLVVSFLGWQWFHAILFPWALLILMVPVPSILFNQITFPLQMLSSAIAADVLSLLRIPVLRQGNVISLPSLSLEVAEACSGIRSLLSLTALAIILGAFVETRRSMRVALALAAVPIAVATNSLRIVVTGILAEYWDPAKAEGFVHRFSGWLIFLISLSALLQLHHFLRTTRHPETTGAREY